MNTRLGKGIWIAVGTFVLFVAAISLPWLGGRSASTRPAEPAAMEMATLAGSQSCRPCHEKFYRAWSTSFHGLAMQPFTPALAKEKFRAPPRPIRIGQTAYQAQFEAGGGFVREEGPGGTNRHSISHVMGGKNVFYFLTPLPRGRLQVLPVAYDVRRNEWFDTAASAMRHFGDARDRPLDWRDPLYTFNTSCYSCHVSQLSTNYDPAVDTYRTTWAEPGINCETCHGPSGEHVRIFKTLPHGAKAPDPRILSTKTLTPQQQNDSCSICHAKASILTDAFKPGDKFFDHFDLAAYENADFYPDGRDLGENYTLTSWRRSPCAMAGKLTCLHCHTSSGRYRFPEPQANGACLPCHQKRVENVAAHTMHKPNSTGSRCITCHMPTTEFARMRRTDHSMLPPTPAATIAFRSPNACNICHADKDAAWSDKFVRQWHKDDYQAPVMRTAKLIDAARRSDWTSLPEMLAYVTDAKRDEIVATSLVRLLAGCVDERKTPAMISATKDRSPLVRAAAAGALTGTNDPGAINALLAATGDDYRLVRIRAAGSLTGRQADPLSEEGKRLAGATAELESSLKARPDDWASQYNLGNYFADRSQPEAAIAAYRRACKFRPDAVQPLVNLAMLYSRLGQPENAEQALTKAMELEPANAVANFNLGLLRAEQGDLRQAERHLRAAVKADPAMAQAWYNLAVIASKDRPAEAIDAGRQAVNAQPNEPKYAYTLAFFLNQSGKPAEAEQLLAALVARGTDYLPAYGLLVEIYQKDRRVEKAADVCRAALNRRDLTPSDRRIFQAKLMQLQANTTGTP